MKCEEVDIAYCLHLSPPRQPPRDRMRSEETGEIAKKREKEIARRKETWLVQNQVARSAIFTSSQSMIVIPISVEKTSLEPTL